MMVMDEKQTRVIQQINLEEVSKGLGYQRTMLYRVQGHTDAVNDPALNIAMIELDQAIARALKIAYELERKTVNRVYQTG